MPVGGVFEPILRGTFREREQTDDRVAASACSVDPRIREEFDRLADAEFML
jgi:hypothetical protein